MADLVNITIDDIAVSVPKGTLLIEAAKQIKQEIPNYCYHTKLGPAGLCRVCLVEIEGMPKLQIACNLPVTDGMVVHTQGDKVNAGRSMVVELFLVNHPLDCPICDKGGECDLQDYAMAYGRGTSDVIDKKTVKPKAVDLGPTIVLDEERCVVCQRCVRFDDIIADEQQLVLKDRGHRDIIATATGDPYHHNFTGNVTELCPVGALTSKTYRFKSRPWDLNRTQTTCTQCPVGCQLFSEVRYGEPLRTMSVEDDKISDGWLCDRGRYNIGFYNAPERITQPLYRSEGKFVQIGWDDAFALWAKAIEGAGPDKAGAFGGGRLTNEEAYLLQHVFRGAGVQNLDWRTGSQSIATLGRAAPLGDLGNAHVIAIVGESPDERAPIVHLWVRKAQLKGAKVVSVASADDAKTIDANGKNVAMIWDGFDAKLAQDVLGVLGDVPVYVSSEQANARGAEAMGMLPQNGGRDFNATLQAARDGKMNLLAFFGVNPALNHPDRDAVREALSKTPFVVVSELFATETAEFATLVLPAKGPFEKNGTTLNLSGELLPVNASLAAPDGVLSDQEMLVGLARALGVALPTEEELHEAVVKAAASTIRHPEPFDSAHGALRTGESRDRGNEARATHLFAGGGTSKHDPRIAALRPAVVEEEVPA